MTSLLERFGRSWSEAARDVVLIVVSILIAFALDAWWDDQNERRVEVEQIATLLSEFRTARDSLRSLSENIERVSVATTRLLTLMGPEKSESDSELLFRLLGTSLNFGGAAPKQTALISVLANGNRLIESSNTLVDLLAGWPLEMEDIERDFSHLERNREIDLQAALIDVGVAGIGGLPVVEALGLPSPAFPAETDRLTRSVRVYAALSYRALRLKILLENVNTSSTKVDRIIMELERL